MQISTRKIHVISDRETRQLEAYYGLAFLWSTTPTDPGSADEVVEFYTTTLIALVEMLGGLSAHDQMAFLARAQDGPGPGRGATVLALLGEYPSPQ